MEILRCGLKTLDELNVAKEAERSRVTPRVIIIKNRGPASDNSSEPVSSGSLNLVITINPSANFNPSDSFWASLLGLSPVRGTSGGGSWPPISIPLVPIYYLIPSSLFTLPCILAYYLFT